MEERGGRGTGASLRASLGFERGETLMDCCKKQQYPNNELIFLFLSEGEGCGKANFSPLDNVRKRFPRAIIKNALC